jgi:hypothetical protein
VRRDWIKLALPAIAATAAAATAAATTAAIVAATAATATPVATAATAATTATAVAAAAAAAAAAALLARLSFVHAERAPVEGRAVHGLHRLCRFIGGAHGHERETARAAGLAIRHEVDVGDSSELLEGSANAVGVGVERKVSYIQTSVHRLLNWPSDW